MNDPSKARKRAAAIVVTFALISGASLLLISNASVTPASSIVVPESKVVAVDDELVPPHREPPSPLPPPSPSPKPSPKPKPKPIPKPVRVVNVDVYRGLGAWVDVYDTSLDPATAVDEMARHGVRTLFLETNNYRSGEKASCQYGPGVDILNPETVSAYLDIAHVRGINVVAWYVPGFADIDRDIRRSLAAINFVSSKGNRFDGYAADIETRGEFGCKGVTGDQQRVKFNEGIVEYSTKLRSAVGPGKVIGGIVVDAKNNERAPDRWAGFPWPQIAQNYDVIMPMAYWTAAKPKDDCRGTDFDTLSYVKDVKTKTEALMGTTKPFHVVGGVADCVTVGDVAGYVAGVAQIGSLGGSLYDFVTIKANPGADAIWNELSKIGK